MPSSKAASFARGFVTGKPEDVASAAGMLTGDLFVFGDIRDVVREGWRGLNGEEMDTLVLGLAGRHCGDGRPLCERRARGGPRVPGCRSSRPRARADMSARRFVRLLKVEKREGLVQFVGDLGRVQSRSGMRGADGWPQDRRAAAGWASSPASPTPRAARPARS